MLLCTYMYIYGGVHINLLSCTPYGCVCVCLDVCIWFVCTCILFMLLCNSVAMCGMNVNVVMSYLSYYTFMYRL